MRPVYPETGYTESDLDDLLATSQFVFADCYTITLIGGQELRYTTAQQDVTALKIGEASYATWVANEVLISGLRFKIGVGVEVDEQTVTLSYHETDLIQGQIFPYALRLGWFDGALIRRDRYYAADWGIPKTNWIAGMPMFVGKVSTLDSVGRTTASIKVKSALVLLNIDMPRLTWQPDCVNTWGDIGCGIDKELYAVSVTTVTGGTKTVLPWAGASAEFKLGKVYVENGDGVTRVRSIKEVDPGVSVTLSYPLDFEPLTGTQFVAYPGCDRTYDGGCAFYANQDQFRGYPFIPVAETAA